MFSDNRQIRLVVVHWIIILVMHIFFVSQFFPTTQCTSCCITCRTSFNLIRARMIVSVFLGIVSTFMFDLAFFHIFFAITHNRSLIKLMCILRNWIIFHRRFVQILYCRCSLLFVLETIHSQFLFFYQTYVSMHDVHYTFPLR